MPRIVKLETPISEQRIRDLHVGEQVELSGVIFTGRDRAHKYMVETLMKGPRPQSEEETYQNLKRDLAGSIIYHCGPVVQETSAGVYQFVAAGPTTSIREEIYQADVIAHFSLRGVIGKGGMAARTLEGCRTHGAVYLHAIGGAATLIAETVKEVLGVYKLEFGVPEALWKIRVENFPAVVTMDSHGQSLHDAVKDKSGEALSRLLAASL